MNVNQLLQTLQKLQTLERDETWDDNMEKQIAELRAQIPPPILGHYDRLSASGKKGVAAVRNQVCTGCHVQVPRATVIHLMHGEDLQICDNCGCYLYLPETKEPEAPKKTKSRKRAELAHAA